MSVRCGKIASYRRRVEMFLKGDLLCWTSSTGVHTWMYLGILKGAHTWLKGEKLSYGSFSEYYSCEKYFMNITSDERVFAVIRDGVELRFEHGKEK